VFRSLHLYSVHATVNEHPTFGSKVTKGKHALGCTGITRWEVLMAVKMWLAVVWVKALCSVIGAFLYGTSLKMEEAGTA
jgi:hypothetical protein